MFPRSLRSGRILFLSPDGKRFVKSKEMAEAFSQTEAYSDLFMELSTNTDAAIEFAKGIMPAELNVAEATN